MDVKSASGKYARFFAYLIVVVLVNVVGMTLFLRADLTENRIYSISDASREAVSDLSEPLTIKVFFTNNLPAPYNSTERYLRDLLEEYSSDANNNFNYRFYDVSLEEGDISKRAKENQELAKNYGIYPVQIQVVEKDEVKFQNAYMGLVLIHGDLIERIPTITSTDGLEYKLTTAIRKLNNKVSVMLALPDKISIKLFLSSSLEVVAPFMRLQGLSELPKKIEEVVKKLNHMNYGKLEFDYLDPSRDKDLEKVLEKYDILRLKWPALSNGTIQPGKGAIGLVMEYADRVTEVPLINVLKIPVIGTKYELVDIAAMEETINKNLETLIDINEDIGYLADHGTIDSIASLGKSSMRQQMRYELSNFRLLTSQNYTMRELLFEDGAFPDSINCLIIIRPTETFSDYELFQIDQFLMRGKSLAIFLDTFNEVMPQNQPGMDMGRQGPMYLPLNTGLEKLLAHYGISVKKSYLMDESCYKQRVSTRMGGGERAIYFAPMIKDRFINHDLEFMRNIKGLIVLKISPLELDSERIKEKGIEAHRLFSSSEKSWEMSGRINLNPIFIQPPKSEDEKHSMPLAYILEGSFPSYFDGKPIPEKPLIDTDSEKSGEEKSDDEKLSSDMLKIEGEGGFLSKGKPGKIFVMASSEVLKNNVIDAEGRGPDAMFLMNVLDVLNNREEIALMRSKVQRFNPLRETGAGTKAFVKYFNIAGLSVLVVLFGLVIWFWQHGRKKRIQMIFQK